MTSKKEIKSSSPLHPLPHSLIPYPGIVNHHVFYFDSVDDLTSNGLVGTKNGAIKSVLGKIDKAISLQGKEQFIELGNGEITNWVGNIDAAPHGQLVGEG